MRASFHGLFCGVCLLAVSLAAVGAPFVPPAEKNPPFRRDRLPIDIDTMASLSKSLTSLTQAGSLETAQQRRAAAQALGLALALDPANSAARENLSALAKGERLRRPDDRKLAVAKTLAWQTLAWLSVPEAGADGNVLGALMADTISVLDRDHPAADALRKDSEQAIWGDWVAPLSAFKEEAAAGENVSSEGGDTNRGNPGVLLEKASLNTVLHTYDEKSRVWSLGLSSITMEASSKSLEKESSRGLVIRISGPEEQSSLIEENVAAPIKDALSNFLRTLPKQGEIKLLAGPDGNYSFRRNRSNLTGPGFILAHAALSGSEPEGTVIAELDGNDRMVLPDHFWRSLRALPEEEGGRLVVPAEAEEYLVSFLALEKPRFFLNYEVLLASSNEEFIALCKKESSGKTASASAKFREIVEKSEGNPTGNYLANRFVRQRLQEVVDEAPNHLSAKLLAIQGGGMRPRYLSKKVLAAEVWRAVDVVGELTGELTQFNLLDLNKSQMDRLEEIYEEMREQIDGLERYADTRDTDLVKGGRDLALTVRNLSRALRSRGEFDEKLAEVEKAYREMTTENDALCEKLSELSGDPLPRELGEKGRRRREPDQ